jgi:LysM repeat protein
LLPAGDQAIAPTTEGAIARTPVILTPAQQSIASSNIGKQAPETASMKVEVPATSSTPNTLSTPKSTTATSNHQASVHTSAVVAALPTTIKGTSASRATASQVAAPAAKAPLTSVKLQQASKTSTSPKVVRVSAPAPAATPAKVSNTESTTAQKSANAPANTVNQLSRLNGTYVIQAGDTLSKIARAYSTSCAALLKLNPTLDPQMLVPGKRINVPHRSASISLDDVDVTVKPLPYVAGAG